ncbi:MAG: response regulator [Synergistetes bacterium]|nr:response regulator [Synergistota bacterium]MDW8191596.1 response regulator [Synergistota bacterium]
MINVLIVEDDPMVAEINRKCVNMVDGFSVVGVARSAVEAKRFLEISAVDLIILDIYMPGESGITFLKELRRLGYKVDVIMVTADNQSADVEEALRYGVFDYLIKPFDLGRLKCALCSYLKKKSKIKESQSLSQSDLDVILAGREEQSFEKKGFDRRTIERILSAVRSLGKPVSAEEVSKVLGISRVTVKKYLDYLEEEGLLISEICYRSAGRPITLYKVL